MKRLILSLFLCILLFTLSNCHKKKADPTPKPIASTPVTSAQLVIQENIANTFTLINGPSSTYNTSIAAEEILKANGHSYYVLLIKDNSSTVYSEFWFNTKPSPGTYDVEDILVSYTNGVTPGKVAIGLASGAAQYFSDGVGSVTVSNSGSHINITTADNIIVEDKDENPKSFSCNVIFP